MLRKIIGFLFVFSAALMAEAAGIHAIERPAWVFGFMVFVSAAYYVGVTVGYKECDDEWRDK